MPNNNNNNNNNVAPNTNNVNPAQQQNPPPNGFIQAITRGIMIYMLMNVVKNYASPNQNQGQSSTSTPNNYYENSNANNDQGMGMTKPRGVTPQTQHQHLHQHQHQPMTNIYSNTKPSCLWSLDTIMDLHVYITDKEEYPLEHCDPKMLKKEEDSSAAISTTTSTTTTTDTVNGALAEWHEFDLKLGPKTSKSNSNSKSSMAELFTMESQMTNARTTNLTIPLTHKVQFNETHIYAHVCLVRRTATTTTTTTDNDNDDALQRTNTTLSTANPNIYLKTIPLTKHKQRKRTRNEKNLLAKQNDDADDDDDADKTCNSTTDNSNENMSNESVSPLTLASKNFTQNAVLLYIKPSLTINLVDMKTLPPFSNRNAIPKPIAMHMAWFNESSSTKTPTTPLSSIFYPILYNNEFWITKKSLIEVNDKIHSHTIQITFDDISIMKWQFMSSMEESWKTKSQFSFDQQNDEESNDSNADMIRTLLLETNPYLLAITVIVSVLHSIFDILAFKNDISFFKGRKSMQGISLRSMIVNTAFQVVILLYLMDNETSFMIMVSNGVGVAIEIWKISKALKLTLYNSEGKLELQVTETELYAKSTTKEFDEIATDHLMYITMPLVTGYGMYSLFHQKHKGWYSWILNTLVGFIYMFGFVMMTPQLFINYKLQSVAHLNWRTMSYKSINTFIDDLFAFVIRMPIMHRLACLRDDVIFLIFCYQKYKYRTDFTRVNEYGQCAQPTEEMMKEKEEEVRNAVCDTPPVDLAVELKEGNESTGNLKQRRGARDKKVKITT
mmetsp:Transcript_20462/g.23711  ORF Transcript_20462/g.23711 Transcript_20462/m.23711 type:complete len:782 (+) Transcript_20462:182-2527(+)